MLASGCSQGTDSGLWSAGGNAPGLHTDGSVGSDTGDASEGTAAITDASTGDGAMGTTGAEGVSGSDGSTTGVGEEGDSGGSSEGGDSTTGVEPVVTNCDPGFALTPMTPVAGAPVHVAFTAAVPHVYIGLWVDGPGQTSQDNFEIDGNGGNGPWTWSWDVDGLTPGEWTLTFVHDTDVAGGTCSLSL